MASGHESPVRHLARLPPPDSGSDESIHVEWRVAVKHVVHRAGELRGEDAQRLGLAVLFHQREWSFCPAGFARRKSAAASENAHFKWWLPCFRFPVPFFLPFDVFSHLISRQ